MNDADLEKLTIKPGTLNPAFDRNITEYEVTLESTSKQITVTPMTRDVDSSWTIVGHGTNKQIPLKEGETKIVIIEVTAEDGTEKRYTVNVTVLSASDASLSGIKLSSGILSPSFNHNILEYDVNLPWDLESVKILPEARDKDVSGANKYLEVSLNYGRTSKVIELVSPNKMSSKKYQINFIKERILRLVTPVKDKHVFYCSICLGEVHCPVSFKEENTSNSSKIMCCRACMNLITQTRKINPFTDIPLSPSFMFDEEDMDSEQSKMEVFCCYRGNGCEASVELLKLGNHMSSCGCKPILDQQYDVITTQNLTDKREKKCITVCDVCSRPVFNADMSAHKEFYCPAKRSKTRFDHVIESHGWEKTLQQKCNMDLVDTASDIKVTEKDDKMQLDSAAARSAGVIKLKPRDALGHFKLGTIMEEMFYAQDIWGAKKMETEKEEDESIGEDVMDMEIRAICKTRGVDEDAELSRILKALDEEYRQLLLDNQSTKADYLQSLYIWKSKQSVGKTNTPLSQAVDEVLERALIKFMDASSCDPDNPLYHINVGRLFLLQKKYNDAVMRLELAFGLKPTSIEAKFYLGLAYAKQNPKQDRPGNTIVNYLQEGINYILYQLFEGAVTQSQPQCCSTQKFVRDSNVLIIEGMLELAMILFKKESPTEKEREKTIGMFRETSKVCIEMLRGLKHKNTTYKQLQWIALRSQFSFGMVQSQMVNSFTDKEEAVKYWERLGALSKAFELPNSADLLHMIRDIWEEAVALIPSNSKSLYRLGDAQLAIYDYMAKGNNYCSDKKGDELLYLEEAARSYRASMLSEGQPINGSVHSSLINDSIWWKKRLKNTQEKPMSSHAKTEIKRQSQKNDNTVKPVNKTSTVVKRDQFKTTKPVQTKTPAPSTSKRNSTVTGSRKVTTTKTGNYKSGIVNKSSGQNLAKSVSTHHTGCTTSKKLSKESTVDGTNTTETNKKGDKEVKEQAAKEEAKSGAENKNMKENVVMNDVSYKARLGLARVLSRSQNNDQWTELVDLYKEVMKLAPDVHDAYIELGELLSQKEPKEAIKIYSQYPFKHDGNFDDAYLYEEIIRLLIKVEDFDNPCLESSMIGYGKVMGLSTLDKTVSILEEKFKFHILMKVYAEVNNKDISDQDLQAFFKFKCWT